MHLEKHCLGAIFPNFVQGKCKKIKWEMKKITCLFFFKDTFKKLHVNDYTGHCTCIPLCMVKRSLRRIFK